MKIVARYVDSDQLPRALQLDAWDRTIAPQLVELDHGLDSHVLAVAYPVHRVPENRLVWVLRSARPIGAHRSYHVEGEEGYRADFLDLSDALTCVFERVLSTLLSEFCQPKFDIPRSVATQAMAEAREAMERIDRGETA